MLYLNDNEEKIIGKFFNSVENFYQKEMILDWGNGNIAYGVYEEYIEDENDEDIESENYEEFWSFIFKITGLLGKPPIFVTEDEYFMINYHNFPQKILVDGKEMN